MKTYNQFISECYYLQEDAGEKFAAMSDDQFADWVKGSPQNAERAKKMRDAAKAKQSSGTSKQAPPKPNTGTNTNTGPNRYQRARQKVKDIYNRAKTAKDKASQTYQNVKDTVKNKAQQAASKAYNTSPKDAVNAAKKATANAKK
jgi:hypothetical protein